MGMRILSFVTLKGGSGKSTLAISLAAHWHAGGKAVAVVDTDPAGTLCRWVQVGTALADLPVRFEDGSDLAASLQRLRTDGVETVIVDTPGFLSALTDDIITRSDLLIIPMRPSPVDFQIAMDTAEHIDAIRSSSRRPPAAIRFVLTQSAPRSVISRHLRQQIHTGGHVALHAELPLRVAYAEAAMMGSTPGLYQPRGPAAADIAALAAELETLLQDPPASTDPDEPKTA
jgi:chromosome partitioning protein